MGKYGENVIFKATADYHRVAVTGLNSKDIGTLGALPYELAAAVAKTRNAGLLTADIPKVTGQDKRCLTGRINKLVALGICVKRFLPNGKNQAYLKHRKFVDNTEISNEDGTELPSNTHVLRQRIVLLVKQGANGLRSFYDLKEQLHVKSRANKRFNANIKVLVEQGCIQKVRAPSEYGIRNYLCLQYLKDYVSPNDYEDYLSDEEDEDIGDNPNEHNKAEEITGQEDEKLLIESTNPDEVNEDEAEGQTNTIAENIPSVNFLVNLFDQLMAYVKAHPEGVLGIKLLKHIVGSRFIKISDQFNEGARLDFNSLTPFDTNDLLENFYVAYSPAVGYEFLGKVKCFKYLPFESHANIIGRQILPSKFDFYSDKFGPGYTPPITLQELELWCPLEPSNLSYFLYKHVMTNQKRVEWAKTPKAQENWALVRHHTEASLKKTTSVKAKKNATDSNAAAKKRGRPRKTAVEPPKPKGKRGRKKKVIESVEEILPAQDVSPVRARTRSRDMSVQPASPLVSNGFSQQVSSEEDGHHVVNAVDKKPENPDNTSKKRKITEYFLYDEAVRVAKKAKESSSNDSVNDISSINEPNVTTNPKLKKVSRVLKQLAIDRGTINEKPEARADGMPVARRSRRNTRMANNSSTGTILVDTNSGEKILAQQDPIDIDSDDDDEYVILENETESPLISADKVTVALTTARERSTGAKDTSKTSKPVSPAVIEEKEVQPLVKQGGDLASLHSEKSDTFYPSLGSKINTASNTKNEVYKKNSQKKPWKQKLNKAELPSYTQSTRQKTLLEYLRNQGGMFPSGVILIKAISEKLNLRGLDRKTMLRDIESLKQQKLINYQTFIDPFGSRRLLIYLKDKIPTEKDLERIKELVYDYKVHKRISVKSELITKTVRLYSIQPSAIKKKLEAREAKKTAEAASVEKRAKKEKERREKASRDKSVKILGQRVNPGKAKPEKRKKTGHRNVYTLTQSDALTIYRCVVITRSLSKDGLTRWDLIAKYFDNPDLHEAALSRKWSRVRKIAGTGMMRSVSEAWKQVLLRSVQNGVVTKNHLLNIDLKFFLKLWKDNSLTDKEVKNNDQSGGSLDADAEEEDKEELHLFPDHKANLSKYDFLPWKPERDVKERYRSCGSLIRKEEVLLSGSFTEKLHEQIEEHTDEIKQTLKAIFVSDSFSYTPEAVKKVLASRGFSEENTETAVKEMDESKEIYTLVVNEKPRIIIQDRLWWPVNPKLEQSLLIEASQHHQFLNSVQGSNKGVLIPSYPSSGVVASIIHNVLSGYTKLIRISQFHDKSDLYNYSTKTVSSDFTESDFVLVIKNDFNNSMLPGVHVPAGLACSKLWIDVNGKINKPVFQKIITSLIGLVLFRPGISKTSFYKKFSHLLSFVEFEELCNWLIERRCLTTGNHESYFATSNWHAVFT